MKKLLVILFMLLGLQGLALEFMKSWQSVNNLPETNYDFYPFQGKVLR